MVRQVSELAVRCLLLGAVLAAGCGGTEGSAPKGALAYGDPGPPPSFYGTKCAVEHALGAAPACLSTVMREVPGGLHVFLNFCVNNEVDTCQRPPDAYVSLVVPMRAFEPGSVTEATGGRFWLRLPDGREHEARAEMGRPLPIDLQVNAVTVPSGDVVNKGTLRVALPRVGGGDPLLVEVRIN